MEVKRVQGSAAVVFRRITKDDAESAVAKQSIAKDDAEPAVAKWGKAVPREVEVVRVEAVAVVLCSSGDPRDKSIKDVSVCW